MVGTDKQGHFRADLMWSAYYIYIPRYCFIHHIKTHQHQKIGIGGIWSPYSQRPTQGWTTTMHKLCLVRMFCDSPATPAKIPKANFVVIPVTVRVCISMFCHNHTQTHTHTPDRLTLRATTPTPLWRLIVRSLLGQNVKLVALLFTFPFFFVFPEANYASSIWVPHPGDVPARRLDYSALL